MAVEIDIEGQRVVISDVATEATLQKLVDKLGGTQSPFGQEAIKAGKEYTRQQKENTNQGKQTTVQLKGLGKQAGDAASELDRAAEASRTFSEKFTGFFTKIATASKDVIQFGASVQGQGLSLSKVGQGVDQFGSSLGPIAAAFGAFGGAMIAHTANLVDTFQGLSTTGAMFTNDLFELENVAARSYLSLDEMTGMIRENSEALATFGGSAKLGAKRFAELNLGLQSTYRNELRQLGYGAKESADMLASFVAVNARNAHFGTMSTQQQTAAAAGFAKEMNLMASLTGQDRKQLADKLAKDKRRADVELKLSRMGTEEAGRARQAFQALEQQFGANSPVLEAFRAKFLGQDVVIGNPAANMLLSGAEPMGVALGQIATGMSEGNMTVKGAFELLSKTASKQIDANKSLEGLAPYSEFAMTMTQISEGSLGLAKRHQEVVTKFNGDYAAFFKAQETNLDKTSQGIIKLTQTVEDAGAAVRTTMNSMTKSSMTAIVGAIDEVTGAIKKALTDSDYMTSLSNATTSMNAVSTAGHGASKALGKLAEKIASSGAGKVAGSADDVAGGMAAMSKQVATDVAAKSATSLSKWIKGIPILGALVDGGATALEAVSEGKSTGRAAVEGTVTAGGSWAGGAAGSALAAKAALPLLALGPAGILAYGAAVLGGGVAGGLAGSTGGEMLGEWLGEKLGGIFGFADGGVIKQPTLALLGEAGKDEAVVNLGPSGKIGVEGIDTAPLADATNAMRKSLDVNAQVAGYSAQMLIEMKKFNANMDRLRTTMQ
jgi:hypothetical protein